VTKQIKLLKVKYMINVLIFMTSISGIWINNDHKYVQFVVLERNGKFNITTITSPTCKKIITNFYGRFKKSNNSIMFDVTSKPERLRNGCKVNFNIKASGYVTFGQQKSIMLRGFIKTMKVCPKKANVFIDKLDGRWFVFGFQRRISI
jgi:hypothetical protein